MDHASPASWPALYASGVSLRGLARLAGVTYPVVRRALVEAGVQLRPSGWPCNPNGPSAVRRAAVPGAAGHRSDRAAWREQAVKMHRQGVPRATIAAEFGVHPNSVSRAVRKAKPPG